VSVCLIDDCQDADVPLAELVFADIYIFHRFYPHSQGCSFFRLIGDYYNRALSGWEPAIEKWGSVFSKFCSLVPLFKLQLYRHVSRVLSRELISKGCRVFAVISRCKVRWNSGVQECGNKLSVEVEGKDFHFIL